MAASVIIQRIISGGQTGVDRAALDVSLKIGIPCGGWCPGGRRAEDGVIPAKYPLQETDSRDYAERTRMNVIDSDGTLILIVGEVSGGTAYTIEMAKKYDKPFLVIHLDKSPESREVIEWIEKNQIHVLNVAGPREDKQTEVYNLAVTFLQEVL